MNKLVSSAGVALLCCLNTQAGAATYTVTNTSDSGSGSLRQSILDANSAAGNDTIEFAITGTITLTGGQLTITDDLIIDGPGANNLTVSGNNLSRVFEISSGSTVGINDLSVSNGLEERGAGIRNSGELLLANSIVRGNSASFGGGGGIESTGTLTISSSTVTGNFAPSNGGGIENRRGGRLTIVDSTINDNAVGAGGEGAGIMAQGDFWLINSTVSGNKAEIDYAFGGGIACFEPGSATLINSTISNNTAADEYTGGAGIFSSGCHVTLGNTIIVGNTVNAVVPADCHLQPDEQTSLGHNLLGVREYGCIPDGPGDRAVALDEVFTTVLGPLKDNGGPTKTHALLPGSPAIDMGSNALIPAGTAADQRGFPRIVNGTVDIGAFELGHQTLVSIDIKPHSATNRINLDSGSYIWVAVMSSTATAFDPLQTDINTVRFGPNRAAPQGHHVKDLNGDGLGDLVLRFDTNATGIDCFDTHASISGVTYSGEAFSGTDFVTPRSANCGQREVSIDIKPLSSINRVFPGSDTNLFVAVLSDTANQFEPNGIDVPTVRFGPGKAGANGFHTKDFNGDGIDDLVLHFSNLAARIECGDTEATLTGSTLTGEKITGSDLVSTRGCF